MGLPDDAGRMARFGPAMAQAIADRNVEAGAVAHAVGIGAAQFDTWLQGSTEPWPTVVFDIEHVLMLVPGQLSQHLGYVPVAGEPVDRPLADVVERSDLLGVEEKAMVVRLIRLLVARHQMRLSQSVPDRLPRSPRAGCSRRRVSGGATLQDLKEEWTFALREAGATRNTVENYRSAVEQLRLYLAREGRPPRGLTVRPIDIEDFLADLLLRNTVRTVTSRYRALRVFFSWATMVGELPSSPMDWVRPPATPRSDRRASLPHSGPGGTLRR